MDKKLGQHGVFWQIQTTKQDEDKRDRSYTTTPLPNFPRDSSDTASALSRCTCNLNTPVSSSLSPTDYFWTHRKANLPHEMPIPIEQFHQNP